MVVPIAWVLQPVRSIPSNVEAAVPLIGTRSDSRPPE